MSKPAQNMEVFLWYFCLYAMIFPTTVLSIHPPPRDSLDWCAKENSSFTSAPPPPEPTFHNLVPFPSFNCQPLTKEECDAMTALPINPSCVGSTVVDLNFDKPETRAYDTMFAMKFRNVSLGMQTVPPNRAVILRAWDLPLSVPVVTLAGGRHFAQELMINQALDPIRHNIIDFRLYNCGNRCPAKLPALNFTSLLSLTFTCDPIYRTPELIFRRVDFAQNPRLRSVTVAKCPKLDIEPHTFTHLPDLRLLALENDFFGSSMEKWETWSYLRHVHCDCEYAWLRDFFRVNPGLITAKAKGSMYQVCQVENRELTKEDIFVPVNCSMEYYDRNENWNWKQSSYSAKGAFGNGVRYRTDIASVCSCVLLLVTIVH